MKKDNLSTFIGPLVVIIVCIALSINVIILNTSLSSVKVRLSKVYELQKQVDNLRINYENQYKMAETLQRSLDVAQKDIEDLQTINADLEKRLKGAMSALNASPVSIPAK